MNMQRKDTMPVPGKNLKINDPRLWDSLMEMVRIGPGVAGGNNRQSLTEEDGEGHACSATGSPMRG